MKKMIVFLLACLSFDLLLNQISDVKLFTSKCDAMNLTENILKRRLHLLGKVEDFDFGAKLVHIIKYDHSGNQVSFSSQLTDSNNIYVIHDDFVLNESVVIPANCVLRFEGGSLNNGTLVGNDTRLEGNLNGVFSNVTIDADGTWNVPYISTDFFNNISDSITDESLRDRSKDNLIHNVLRMASDTILNEVVIKGNYWVDVEGDPSNHIAIRTKCNTKYFIHGSIRMISHNYAKSSLIHTAGCHNVLITGGRLYGDKLGHIYYDGNSYPDGYIPGFARRSPKPSGYNPHQNNQVIYVSGKDIILDSINIYNSTADGLYINNATSITVKNFGINNARRNGISVIDADKLVVENGYIDTVKGTGPEKGIDVEPNPGNNVYSSSFRSIYITNASIGFGVNNSNGNECKNISFDNIKVDNCCIGFNSAKAYNIAVRNCAIDAKGRGFKIYPEEEGFLYCLSFQNETNALVENCIINFNVPYLKTGFDKTDESKIKNYDSYLTYDENDPDVDNVDVKLLKSTKSNACVISSAKSKINIKDNTISTNAFFMSGGEKYCNMEGNTITCKIFTNNLQDTSKYVYKNIFVNNKILITGMFETKVH